MKMEKIDTGIDGLVVFQPKVFGDERGYFMESYNKETFKSLGLDVDFIQDNESKSKRGVLRGLHFQTNNPQGKLVRCSQGVIWDVAVDLRPGSATFGKWYGIELSAENKTMMYIPPMFAHGFVVLSEEAVFNYKCTQTYDAESDSGIMYNLDEVGITWPEVEGELIISDKDLKHTLSIHDITWR
jgi:dTDP-4-dehydrorhamnose 3,5-epimerase